MMKKEIPLSWEIIEEKNKVVGLTQEEQQLFLGKKKIQMKMKVLIKITIKRIETEEMKKKRANSVKNKKEAQMMMKKQKMIM